jgi:acylglycerol lipase
MTLLLTVFLLGLVSGRCLPALLSYLSAQFKFDRRGMASRTLRRDAADVVPLKGNFEGMFLNKNNLYIHYRTWPNPKASCVAIVCHGVGEHSGRYQQLAEALVQRGFAVYALDHEGHGQSEGDRMFVNSFQDLVDPVMTLAGIAGKDMPARDQYLVGHSMGGLIAARVLQQFPKHFKAAVLSAPALDVPATALERKLAPVMSKFLPKLPLARIDPGKLCHDKKVVDWYVNDPLNCTDGVSARLGCEVLGAIDQAQAQAGSVKLPLLVIRGDSDQVCLAPGIRAFFDQLASKDKTFIELAGLFHEIFNEPATPAIRVVCDWLAARAPSSLEHAQP